MYHSKSFAENENYQEDFNLSENGQECFSIAQDLVNDISASSQRIIFIKSVLQGDYEKNLLDDEIKNTQDENYKDFLETFFYKTQKLDIDERSSIYNNLFETDKFEEQNNNKSERHYHPKITEVAENTDKELEQNIK